MSLIRKMIKCNVNDLVYWYDPWTNDCGIGIVLTLSGLWIEILVAENKQKLLLAANQHNISSISNYKNLTEFLSERSFYKSVCNKKR